MRVSAHTAASVGLGTVIWLLTKSVGAASMCFAVGVFLDLDHLPDMLRWFSVRRNDRIYLFAHSWELLPLLLFAAALSGWNLLLVAALSSFALHLALDQWVNRAGPFTYFFVYRLLNKFQAQKMRRRLLPPPAYNPKSSSLLAFLISQLKKNL